MRELGCSLRAAREAAGVSLAALAARTHFSKALLGHLETGKRTVSPEHVTAYSRALDVPVSDLYGGSGDPLRVAHEWLVGDSPVALHSAAGRRVGAGLADELESRVVQLRHLDDVVGGDDLHPLVQRELTGAEQAVEQASYPASIGQRLRTVVGELAQLAGWVFSDAGRYRKAQRVYLSGVSAAREAGNDALAAQLLSSLSYQIANVGNPADAVLLARSAVKGASGSTSVVRTLLLERLAWASARARDSEGTARVLDEVDCTYESRSAGVAEPEWVYWLDRKEIDVMAGRCLIELDKPAEAEPLISGAVSNYAPEHAREIALYRTWIAESFARTHELDAARAELQRARQASRQVRSTRLAARIDDVERIIATR